ncbi:metallophosphoesterase family protein [Microvirga sp. 2TAF3]|uniref:metallophosphoesterase family protein n=1 Tax=Microvirga sp. 2TAF3 TaxID=3233014 RepID=UPI003F9AF2E3
MRAAIISDVHANLEALQSTLRDISTRNVDRIVCLGDIVGYNANPAECIELLQGINALCVAGNHDRAVTGQITTEGFNETAAKAVHWTRRRLGDEACRYLAELPVQASLSNRLVAVHGALHPKEGNETVRLDNDERRRLSFEALVAHPSGARVCAFGHTHQLGIFELRNGFVRKLTDDHISLQEDGWYLINPGTVGQPRTTDLRATYLVHDSTHNTVTTHRVDYDATIPFAKTRRARLVPIWSSLPEPAQVSLKRLPKPIRNTLKGMAKALGL